MWWKLLRTHLKFNTMGIFGKTDNEINLSNQVKALQDSVELQRRKAEEAEAALALKEKEMAETAAQLKQLCGELEGCKVAMHKLSEESGARIDELSGLVKTLNMQIADKDAQIGSLTAIVNERNAEICKLKGENVPNVEPEQPRYVAETPTPAPTPQVEISVPDYAPQLDAIKADISSIKESYSDLVRKDEMFNAMHKELDTLRNDVYAKLTRPYKVSIISLYDSIVSTYNYYKERKDEDGSYERLMKQLNNYIMSIVDMLCDEYNLDSFEAVEGEPFDRKLHKTMNVVDTDEPEKHGTVARALQCGFRYTAFDAVKGVEREVVFRPAIVDTYKLKK